MYVSRVKRTYSSEIDSLLSGEKWQYKYISFSFPKEISQYGPDYEHDPPRDFTEVSDNVKEKVRAIFAEIERVVDVRFVEMSQDPGQAIIRIGQCRVANPNAFYPHDHGCAGDIWLPATDKYRAPEIASFAHHAIRHEIGHALGLKHPHESQPYGRMPAEMDSTRFTVMSYDSHRDVRALGCDYGDLPQSLMPLDLLALQSLYGARVGVPASDDVYSWDPSTGARLVNGTDRGGATGSYVFEMVADSGGWDTFDFSNYTNPLTISLRPGEACHAKRPPDVQPDNCAERIAVFTPHILDGKADFLIEVAIGGAGDDYIEGNHVGNCLRGGAGNDLMRGGAGDDLVEGGDGDDVISGDEGDDFLVGGGGRNLFVVFPGCGRDVIPDFKAGSGNVIDLRHFHLKSLDDVAMSDSEAFGGSATLQFVEHGGERGGQLTLIGMSVEAIRSEPDIILL
ncbi:hemolysin type calcium-binding protein [Chelatococcus asaccharovorans]|uniref:Hemolysin type calcium-binding protein n=2 Tax=Chelatococcus asaccharovorans TaxID=28210 RepID=A0A2V3U7F7_9HYPH|nr:hemolysin type calcium-binding protein [Chelatococcus asaccharovorans]